MHAILRLHRIEIELTGATPREIADLARALTDHSPAENRPAPVPVSPVPVETVSASTNRPTHADLVEGFLRGLGRPATRAEIVAGVMAHPAFHSAARYPRKSLANSLSHARFVQKEAGWYALREGNAQRKLEGTDLEGTDTV